VTGEVPSPDIRAITRLEAQVEFMAKEVHRLNNLIMGASSPTDARLSQLEKSVSARMETLDENQKALASTIERLSEKIEARSKFPFPTVFAFCSLLFFVGGGVGGIILNGFRGDLNRIERDISSVQAQVVPRIEHQSRWDSHNDAINKLQGRIDVLENRRGR